MGDAPSATFAGDKKKGQSILGTVERRFIDWAVPKIPRPMFRFLINKTLGIRLSPRRITESLSRENQEARQVGCS